MRLSISIIFVLTIFPTSLTAQEEERESKWSATFTGAIISMAGAQLGIQPGTEYKLNDRFSLLTEVTFQTGKNQHSDSSALNKKYFRIKPELRYKFRNTSGRIGAYLGLQCSYTFRSFTNAKNGFYHLDFLGDSVNYFDRADVKGPVSTISFQTGLLFSEGKNFYVDMFLGPGVRFVNTNYSEVINPKPGIRRRAPDGFTLVPAYLRQGKSTRLHIATGIRFIYRFNQ